MLQYNMKLGRYEISQDLFKPKVEIKSPGLCLCPLEPVGVPGLAGEEVAEAVDPVGAPLLVGPLAEAEVRPHVVVGDGLDVLAVPEVLPHVPLGAPPQVLGDQPHGGVQLVSCGGGADLAYLTSTIIWKNVMPSPSSPIGIRTESRMQ